MKTREGLVLTERDLDRIVEDAEAGHDLTAWIRRPGRPSVDSSNARGHSPKIETRVPVAVRNELARIAAEDGTTVSHLLRGLAEQYVAQRRATRRP